MNGFYSIMFYDHITTHYSTSNRSPRTAGIDWLIVEMVPACSGSSFPNRCHDRLSVTHRPEKPSSQWSFFAKRLRKIAAGVEIDNSYLPVGIRLGPHCSQMLDFTLLGAARRFRDTYELIVERSFQHFSFATWWRIQRRIAWATLSRLIVLKAFDHITMMTW